MLATQRPNSVLLNQAKSNEIRNSRLLQGYESKYPSKARKIRLLADLNAFKEFHEKDYESPKLKELHQLYYQQCFKISMTELLECS